MTLWDAIEIGEVADLGEHHFTEEEIVRFAEKFDPQPFHLNAEKAKASVLGGLCASGWHTAAVCMRLNVDHQTSRIAAWMTAGNPAPRIGPSPGVTNLRWPRPVFAGDSVSFRQTVTGKRLSASRPGWGVVEFSTLGLNRADTPVFSFAAAAFIGTD
ncbi:acyl dehydratase [Aureimonas sp. SA4125]|uniref:MaoC family dehydratase n=1 Tax=Aureimonas sp. SA4125 TaxID=2826993 RepID=UPI001CC4CEF9|nr:MaoC family dehydratase [Aureimonas sp. SA4125]BDA85825.1 acyl dehydratase [Aureimonas sp. SA4125]